MPLTLVRNEGSTARDFCMLERNLLSHLKLALLLSLLSSSFLLKTRLFPNPSGNGGFDYEELGLPSSIVLYVAGIITIIGGVWEFFGGHRDLRTGRAFLSAPKGHIIMLTIVSLTVFGTCVMLLATDAKQG
ncbi:hypothetical protein F5887DRAFT_881103 [Amanita rubescens]|nr:hypothetical protein F5887DRAFT_881103 [Amanita rubescens]